LTARSLKAERLGRKRIIDGDDFHTPHVDLLYGKDGWVEHVDNGVRYQYDVTKRMFSSSNISEKQRISEMDCHREVVVDMFAGIGYFTMAYLMNAHAKHVYTLECNGITDRCTVIYGDARRVIIYRWFNVQQPLHLKSTALINENYCNSWFLLILCVCTFPSDSFPSLISGAISYSVRDI
uniref:tRNA(Phe) (4-demethylwyosine(37)-C(7)) aminocarboxypropyltransferase n=1 Tax=Parascaris equorum TaxID=6256 RepID=A0A914R6X7_PAREQ